jgi:hypothetical protein
LLRLFVSPNAYVEGVEAGCFKPIVLRDVREVIDLRL